MYCVKLLLTLSAHCKNVMLSDSFHLTLPLCLIWKQSVSSLAKRMMPVSILDTMQKSWLTRNRMCLDYMHAKLGLAVTFNVVCKCTSLVYSFYFLKTTMFIQPFCMHCCLMLNLV